MEDVKEIITCPICMEIYNSPRVLPCQHTFCEHCLSSLIKDTDDTKTSNKKKMVSCPFCRAVTVIKEAPYDGTAFPKNLTVVALMDSSAVKGVSTEEKPTEEKPTDEPKERLDSEKEEAFLCSMYKSFANLLISNITIRIACYLFFSLFISRAKIRNVFGVLLVFLNVFIYSFGLVILVNYNCWLVILMVYFFGSPQCLILNAIFHVPIKIRFILEWWIPTILVETTVRIVFIVFVLILVLAVWTLQSLPWQYHTYYDELGQPVRVKFWEFDLNIFITSLPIVSRTKLPVICDCILEVQRHIIHFIETRE